MALSLIGVGTTANDGTGDPLRTAFQTVNTALTAVNNAVVVGTGVTTFKDDSGSAGVSVLSSGFVGIGVTAPGEPLHVVGADAIISVDNSTANTGTVGYRLSHIAGSANQRKVAILSDTAGSWGRGNLKFCVNGASTSDDADTGDVCLGIDGLTGDTQFYNAGSTVGMTWDASANSNAGGLGIGTPAPTEQLDLSGDAIRIRTAQTPATASATGVAGTICWDASYIYVCTATNTWKRAAIATW